MLTKTVQDPIAAIHLHHFPRARCLLAEKNALTFTLLKRSFQGIPQPLVRDFGGQSVDNHQQLG